MVRLLLAVALGAIVALVAWNAVRSTSAGPMYGDASCDGQVNSIDAAVVLQHTAALLTTLNCPANADANADGSTNSLDAALILQYGAAMIDTLGPGSVPATPTPTPTPQQCPDGFFWNPSKGHCDSRDCPPGLVFDEELLYCVLP